MTFATIRRLLFQVHMWLGLVLGVFIVVLSLSGAILVYDDKIANFFAAAPRAETAGQRLPLSMIAAPARALIESRGVTGGRTQVVLPTELGEPAIVRFTQTMEKGAPRPDIQVYVDPVSGQVLGARRAGLLPAFAFLHRLHGSFALGRDLGRPLVGWLGVALLALGVSGLVLWWPRRGQWKYAFFVRSTATGLRFHRELHAAVGIWIFLVFMAVSFSGVAISFPQVTRAVVSGGMPAAKPAFDPREGPVVTPVETARPISADAAMLVAQKHMPDGIVRSVTLPGNPAHAYGVALASRFGTTATIYVDSYSARVMAVRDPANAGGADTFMALQRPMHDGQGNLGPVWEFLVFLSGLAPTLFVVTGVIMWIKKRKRRLPMSTLTDDVAPPVADA